MKADDAARIALYRDSMRRAWGKGDTNEWPIKLNAAMHLFLAEFGQEFLDDLSWLESQGWRLDAIARHFGNPARFYRVIDAIIYGMRRSRYSLDEQRRVVLKLLTMTRMLKHGSEFNEDGRNVVYDPARVDEMSRRLDGGRAAAGDSQRVHRFSAALWAYTEAICFGVHDITKEFHGPYHQPGGGSFLVKEFLHLNPAVLWPGVPLLPCRSIVVTQRYTPAIRLAVDSHDHVSHEGAPLVASLDAFAIDIDGAPQDISVVSTYMPLIQQAIAAISRQMAACSWNQKVLKYAEVFWYRKKPLADLRGRDWQLPAAVREQIAAGSENRRWTRRLPDSACERLAMVTI